MRLRAFNALLLGAMLSSAPALALDRNEGTLNVKDPKIDKIGFDQKLNGPVPMDLTFRDETGKPAHLRDYTATGRPLVLALVYFGCPHLCKVEVQGLLSAIQSVTFDAGTEFEIALVSINPKDDPAGALKKKKELMRGYASGKNEKGIHLLTGTQAQITQLADAVGFRYIYDARFDEYAHPAGVMVLTPEGKISRYLFGIDFPPRDLRLALVEASDGKIGTPADRFLLFCYHYDPTTGRYGVAVTRALRIAGSLTVILLLGGVGLMLKRERKRKSLNGEQNPMESP